MQITLNVPEQSLVDTKPVELAQRVQLYAAVLMFQWANCRRNCSGRLRQISSHQNRTCHAAEPESCRSSIN